MVWKCCRCDTVNDAYYICRECGTLNEFDYVCKECGALNDSDYICKKCGHNRCENCKTLDDDGSIKEENQQDADNLVLLLLKEE